MRNQDSRNEEPRLLPSLDGPTTTPGGLEHPSSHLLIAAIEQSDDSILITDASGKIQYVNTAFTRLTGWSRSEAVGSNPRILKSGVHDRTFYGDMWGTLVAGEVWKGKITNRKKTGEQFTEMVTISPVRDSQGVITHFVSVKRDITEEANFEIRNRQSQKMESLGMLAGGVAHDFNNILYAIMGYCQLAGDDVPAGHPVRRSLNEITKAGKRAAKLVAKMMALGGRAESEFQSMDLKVTVAEALDLARASLPSTVRFQRDFPETACGIHGDPTQIHQVVLNLCTNAGYAMREKGGLLRVELESVELEGKEASRWSGLDAGSYQKLSLSDTGTGMDELTRQRVFEPYFTTKGHDEGTGLGLATVQGIIVNHQGRIFVNSAPGEGSTFTVFLPHAPLAAETPPVSIAAPDEPGGSGRILLVDDEEMVVMVTQKGLERLGYQVDAFTDPRQALEAFEKNPHAVDAMVTDETMPHLTGQDLAGKVLTVRPDLPILLMTGYGDRIAPTGGAWEQFDQILSKPLLVSEIGEHLKVMIKTNNRKLEV